MKIFERAISCKIFSFYISSVMIDTKALKYNNMDISYFLSFICYSKTKLLFLKFQQSSLRKHEEHLKII